MLMQRKLCIRQNITLLIVNLMRNIPSNWSTSHLWIWLAMNHQTICIHAIIYHIFTEGKIISINKTILQLMRSWKVLKFSLGHQIEMTVKNDILLLIATNYHTHFRDEHTFPPQQIFFYFYENILAIYNFICTINSIGLGI